MRIIEHGIVVFSPSICFYLDTVALPIIFFIESESITLITKKSCRDLYQRNGKFNK